MYERIIYICMYVYIQYNCMIISISECLTGLAELEEEEEDVS